MHKYFLILLLFLAKPSFTQNFKELKVDLIGQQTSKWCWAACMEMIMKFHEPSSNVTQCELAKKAKIIRGLSPLSSHLAKDCCALNCSDCPLLSTTYMSSSNCTSIHDWRIVVTSESSSRGQTSTFDLLFWQYGYTSMEAINWHTDPMSWEEIKEQLDECRPFILIINPAGFQANAPSGYHAIVAKGYHEIGTEKYIIVNDPWHPCCGEEYYLPFSAVNSASNTTTITSPNPYQINEVVAFVHGIHPQRKFPDFDNSESCSSVSSTRNGVPFIKENPNEDWVAYNNNINTNLLVSTDYLNVLPKMNIKHQVDKERLALSYIVEKNQKKIVGCLDNKLTEEVLHECVTTEDYYITKVKLISFDKILKAKYFRKKKLETLIVPVEVADAVYNKKSENFSIISCFQKTDGNWVLKGITTERFLPNQQKVSLKGNALLLANNRKENAISYTIVKFPPFLYEFYSFSYKDRIYLSPSIDFPEIGFKKGQAYKEQTVLSSLKKEAIKYVKANEFRGKKPPINRRITQTLRTGNSDELKK